jgi:cell division protein FtsN
MNKKERFLQELSQLKSEDGNTLLGMVIGLVIGLGIALGAAYFMQKNPPAERPNIRVPEPNLVPKVNPDGTTTNELKDPNSALYGKPRVPENNAETAQQSPASIEQPSVAPEVKPTVIYWIQVGAYAEKSAAESQKAVLALQGLQSKIFEYKTDTQTTWRVRVGPYSELPEMSGDKNKLDNAGIAYSVIKANKS